MQNHEVLLEKGKKKRKEKETKNKKKKDVTLVNIKFNKPYKIFSFSSWVVVHLIYNEFMTKNRCNELYLRNNIFHDLPSRLNSKLFVSR